MRTLLLGLLLVGSALANEPKPKVLNQPVLEKGWKVDRGDILIPSGPILPTYPIEAIAARQGAAVWIKAKIKKTGEVEKAEIAYSNNPSFGFNELCREAVAKTQFEPSRRGLTAMIPFHFWLDSSVASQLPPSDEEVTIDVQPEMIEIGEPEYPRSAKMKGVEGNVWIRAFVSPEGKVLGAEVTRSSGYKELDDSAVRAAYKCKFKPAMKDGKPTGVWVTYKYGFELGSH